MIKQKKTKKKNVNVNQTVVVNIQKGKRNPRAKASAPQVMNAPQIIPPQVGSAYHQAVYGARAPAIPSMGNIAGYYGGMMSPFNAPLHVVSEVQQAQLRQANELAGANLQRPMERSISRLVGEQEAPIKPKPIRMSFYPGSYEELPESASQMKSLSSTVPDESMPGYGKQEEKPLSVPVSLTPQKPLTPAFSAEASEPAYSLPALPASSSSSSSSEPSINPPAEVIDVVRSIKITQASLNDLPYRRKDPNDRRVFLTDIASSYSIPLPRSVLGSKAEVINYLIQRINR